MSMLESIKKFWADFAGTSYESPEPLRGEVTQSTHYMGNKPSQFSLRGETTDTDHPFSVTTGDAPDKILAASGTHITLYTGGGNDIVYAGKNEEPLSYSSVYLGRGDDVFVPGFQSDSHFQHNFISGNTGKDSILLKSGETFELRGDTWGPKEADGSSGNKMELIGQDAKGWGQYYTLEEFEYLRFETQDTEGHAQVHTFPMEEVLGPETGYNNARSVTFNPDTLRLDISYEDAKKGKATFSLPSMEARATECDTKEILPPGPTPDSATSSKERCR